MRPVVRSPTSALPSGIIARPAGAVRWVATTFGSTRLPPLDDGPPPGTGLPPGWPPPGPLLGSGTIGCARAPGPSPPMPIEGLGSQVGGASAPDSLHAASSPATAAQVRSARTDCMPASLPRGPVQGSGPVVTSLG